jgi:prefoldin subunit 5
MQEKPPAPVVAPPAVQAAPAVPAVPALPGQVVVNIPGAPGASASAIFEALKAQRAELGNQLESLEDKRRDLSQRLEEPMVGGADKRGLEQRITEIDGRISSIDKQIAESEAQIARAAAVPGAVVPPKPIPREGPPEEAFVLGGMFIFVVLLPLSIALARRIWRRGVATITKLPAELTERLTRLEQGMDAVAVEVERIGEGQRYMARLLGDDGSPRAIGAGAAEPVEVKAREAEGRFRR